MKCLKLAAAMAISLASGNASAALIGTQLSIQTQYQQYAESEIHTTGFLTTATVVEPGVEFSSLAATEVENPPQGFQVVDVAINAGDNYLEIDFSNVNHFSFSSAYFNGYVFTFESSVAPVITNATLDTSITTMGLVNSDLLFTGNQLFVNVEGLLFNTSTVARINLDSVNPVPVPAAVWLFGSGLIGLIGVSRRS